MDSDQESDESGLSFDIEDDSHNENESDIELTEEEDNITMKEKRRALLKMKVMKFLHGIGIKILFGAQPFFQKK